MNMLVLLPTHVYSGSIRFPPKRSRFLCWCYYYCCCCRCYCRYCAAIIGAGAALLPPLLPALHGRRYSLYRPTHTAPSYNAAVLRRICGTGLASTSLNCALPTHVLLLPILRCAPSLAAAAKRLSLPSCRDGTRVSTCHTPIALLPTEKYAAANASSPESASAILAISNRSHYCVSPCYEGCFFLQSWESFPILPGPISNLRIPRLGLPISQPTTPAT
ncbi:hypothetical protein AOQ84DRAFT_31954 [Glonium stellatum]|uniref:Uncharacterized protein n=1 Tax=Glonium stellatum TaxID=574774 RepID=A0A8E2F1S9_9PEZI|nr:hypothetical protein AOQ84DRAFT_31954 [Glonium stellatum]